MSLTSSVSTQQTSKILCHYFNSSDRIQIIKVIEHSKYKTNCKVGNAHTTGLKKNQYSVSWEEQRKPLYLEKVIFPQQRILFESTPEGQVEVYLEDNGQPTIKKSVSLY